MSSPFQSQETLFSTALALRVRQFYADTGQVGKVTEWTAEFNSLDAEEKKVLMPPPAK